MLFYQHHSIIMSNISVVTSSTEGIGKAIVKRILKSSGPQDKVIVNYGHNDKNMEILKKELSSEDCDKVIFIKADLSSFDGMKTFVDKVKYSVDHIDWLVLNTGIGSYVSFDECEYETWLNVMNTNLNIPAFLVQAMKSHMADYGKIIFMGSHSGQVPYSSSIVYGVSKSAVHFLAKSLVKVFEGNHICVNAIAPGFIETKWQSDRTDESRQRIVNKIGTHRFGTSDEVAEICYSVLTNDYINGSVLEIHGGYNYF